VSDGANSLGHWHPQKEIFHQQEKAEVRFATIAKVNAGGLIEEDRTYFDNLDFMKQLGIIK